MKRPTFRQWIQQIGDETAASLLEVSPTTAKAYRLGNRIPRLRDVPELIEKSNRKLNAESFIRDFQSEDSAA